MEILLEFLGGDLVIYAGVAVAAILALLGNNKHQRNKGERNADAKHKEADNAKANDIRDVGDSIKHVRYDDIQFRD